MQWDQKYWKLNEYFWVLFWNEEFQYEKNRSESMALFSNSPSFQEVFLLELWIWFPFYFSQFFGLGLSTMFLRPLTSSAFHQVSLGWSCLWKVKQTIKLYTACKPEENQQSNKKRKVLPRTFNVFPHCPPTLSPVFISEVMTTTRAQFPFKLTLLSKRPCQIYQKICCFITTMHPSQPAPWKSLLQQVGLTHQSHKQDAANRNMDPGKDRLY